MYFGTNLDADEPTVPVPRCCLLKENALIMVTTSDETLYIKPKRCCRDVKAQPITVGPGGTPSWVVALR